MTNILKNITLTICLLLANSSFAASINLDNQKEALDIIADFADRLCNKIPLSGHSDNLELTGAAKAELNNLLKKIVNLGIEGAAKYQKFNYENVLQKDLAMLLKESSKCKLEVFKDLKDKLLTYPPTYTDSPKSGFKGTEYFHSPWLGIEIYQGKNKVDMVSQGSYADANILVKMEPKPFMLRIPKNSENDVVQINLWVDDSTFKMVHSGLKTEEVPFYTPGTGIAGARFSIPVLYIDNEAHNYFIDSRLENFSPTQHGISVSKFDMNNNEYHVSEQKDPLYMIVFMDLNKNHIIDPHEVEYFILNF